MSDTPKVDAAQYKGYAWFGETSEEKLERRFDDMAALARMLERELASAHNAHCDAALERDRLDAVLRDEQRHTAALEDENAALREAAAPAVEVIREYIKMDGGCDHSVGICMCHEIRVADNLLAALGSIPARGAEPTIEDALYDRYKPGGDCYAGTDSAPEASQTCAPSSPTRKTSLPGGAS